MLSTGLWCKIAVDSSTLGLFGELRIDLGKLRSTEELFAGRHFDREVIALCVRWYLRYKLSFRDLVEMRSERGLHVAHTTILRWVRQFAPEFIKRWNRIGKSTARSWRVDETYRVSLAEC